MCTLLAHEVLFHELLLRRDETRRDGMEWGGLGIGRDGMRWDKGCWDKTEVCALSFPLSQFHSLQFNHWFFDLSFPPTHSV